MSRPSHTFVKISIVLLVAASGFVAEKTNAQNRMIRASNVATAIGSQTQIEMPIRLVSQGDESSVSFSIGFNPNVFTQPGVALGSDIAPGSSLAIDTTNLAQGRIGIRINSPTPFVQGTLKILTIAFTVAASGNAAGTYPISFGSVPTPQSVLNLAGTSLTTTFQNGNVSIGTADGIPISGRILTPDGRPLANTTIFVTDTDGNRYLARTSSFGQFSLPYVRFFETYTFTVQSKRYRFAPRVIQIRFPLANFDFVGLE